MSTITLNNDKIRNKSLFFYINEKQLVLLPSNYSEPDFVTLDDSSEAPSVHDLFDIAVDPLADPLTPETEDFEMLEYLDEEEL
jgi:hypothetical protein